MEAHNQASNYHVMSGRGTRETHQSHPPLASAGRGRGTMNLPISPVSPSFPPNATIHRASRSIDSALGPIDSALGPMSTAVHVPPRAKRGGRRRPR
jgi:hypothetical protein